MTKKRATAIATSIRLGETVYWGRIISRGVYYMWTDAHGLIAVMAVTETHGNYHLAVPGQKLPARKDLDEYGIPLWREVPAYDTLLSLLDNYTLGKPTMWINGVRVFES